MPPKTPENTALSANPGPSRPRENSEDGDPPLKTGAERKNLPPKKGLSATKLRAINAILRTPTLAAASEACGVPKGTIKHWLREDCEFIAEHNRLNRELYEAVRKSVLSLAPHVHRAAKQLLSRRSTPPGVKAKLLLKLLDMILRQQPDAPEDADEVRAQKWLRHLRRQHGRNLAMRKQEAQARRDLIAEYGPDGQLDEDEDENLAPEFLGFGESGEPLWLDPETRPKLPAEMAAKIEAELARRRAQDTPPNQPSSA